MANFVKCCYHYAMTILTISLRQGQTFIGIFYDIFRGNTNQNLHLNQLCLYTFIVKPRRKSIDPSPKSVFLDVEQQLARFAQQRLLKIIKRLLKSVAASTCSGPSFFRRMISANSYHYCLLLVTEGTKDDTKIIVTKSV